MKYKIVQESVSILLFLECLSLINYHRLGLRIIRLLATYLQDPANQSLESILASIAQWTPDSTEKTFHIIAATFSIYNQDLKQALKILSSVSSIEGFVALIIYFKLFIKIVCLEKL